MMRLILNPIPLSNLNISIFISTIENYNFCFKVLEDILKILFLLRRTVMEKKKEKMWEKRKERRKEWKRKKRETDDRLF